MAAPLTLPGFVNAHSHAFQRRLRGHSEGGDFWAWREEMLREAERQTPDSVRTEYAATYREMRSAGYTAVGEFHYLGYEEAVAAFEAAAEAEIELALLLTAYGRGGLPRFRQESAAAYLASPEITPVATSADVDVAMSWLRAAGLHELFEPAQRWLAAFWCFALDDPRVLGWCRSVLL